MTASTWLNGNNYPFYGRMNGNRGNGWCAQSPFGNQDWLQVDLGKTVDICGVATQGDKANVGWVTHFKLSHSLDGSGWTTYRDASGTEVVRDVLLV